MLCIERGYWRNTLFSFKIDILIIKIIMLRMELTYDWMCDMSSRIDIINNNKSIVHFQWFIIISQDSYFNSLPP